MQIHQHFKATETIKNFMDEGHTVFGYEVIDTFYDKDWCLETFERVVGHTNVKSIILSGEEFGNRSHPNLKFMFFSG